MLFKYRKSEFGLSELGNVSVDMPLRALLERAAGGQASWPGALGTRAHRGPAARHFSRRLEGTELLTGSGKVITSWWVSSAPGLCSSLSVSPPRVPQDSCCRPGHANMALFQVRTRARPHSEHPGQNNKLWGPGGGHVSHHDGKA